MVTVPVEFALLERFHGDGKHRRYVATRSELSAQFLPALDPGGMLDRPVWVSRNRGEASVSPRAQFRTNLSVPVST
jgi:hypothetical protein